MKILSPEELEARIKAVEVMIKSTRLTGESGFSKKAISSLLFREHGIENYQPLYASKSAQSLMGPEKFQKVREHFLIPRSRIFISLGSKIRSLGLSYSDFTLEHVVDVSTMVDFLQSLSTKEIRSTVYEMGRSCPMCIVTKEEDSRLKKFNRMNLKSPWSEYDCHGIKRDMIRSYCGPLDI